MDAPARHAKPFSHLVNTSTEQINRLRQKSFCLGLTLLVVQASLWSLFFLGVAHTIYPLGWWESLGLLSLTGGLLLVFGWKQRRKDVTATELRLGLELGYPEVQVSAFTMPDQNMVGQQAQAWQGPLAEVVAAYALATRRSIKASLHALIMPAVLLGFAWAPTFDNLQSTFSAVLQMLGVQALRVDLHVEQGALDAATQAEGASGAGAIYQLSVQEPAALELLLPNLVRLKVQRPPVGFEPALLLKRGLSGEGEVFQSFQLSPSGGEGSRAEKPTAYEVSFAITEDVRLILPSLGGDKPLAMLTVKKLPVPVVELTTDVDLTSKPWHDDEPLPLLIKVHTKAPLKTVRLLIRDGRNEAKELVQTITSDDRFDYQSTYELTLEPYVSADLATVEIVAEAVDAAIPTPLRGFSKPLRIETASAYGRYRQTLQTLRELKEELDNGIKEGEPKPSTKAEELTSKAVTQAQETPFFDGLDRVNLHTFKADLQALTAKPGMAELMSLGESLTDFLVEHEIIDDRERDRDFFVAARALSRLVEQAAASRPLSLGAASKHMVSFLDERQARWQRRISLLEHPEELKRWPEIEQHKVFHKPFLSLQQSTAQSQTLEAKSQTLGELASIVGSYRTWLDELEGQEDKERQERESKRQQGLASAQEKLRELQKKQGKIAGDLDQAAQKPKDEWDLKWPIVRMNQNGNFKDTQSLEATVRSLAPKAALRLQAAWKAMQETLESGNKADFTAAESYADLAGRLLRQAEKDSQAANKQQGQRRRRRIAGDRYYGQAVHGGDLEIVREYEVDKRYREEILNEVHDEAVDESSRNLLEDYLRRVIR